MKLKKFTTALELLTQFESSNKTAIETKKETISYKELIHEIKCAKTYLEKKNINKGDVVGVDFDISIDWIISLFAIWSVNGIYLPLDPNQAKERIQWICQDAKPKLILNQSKFWDGLSASKFKSKHTQSLDPAYLIYTSGSTGTPKGVLVPHEGITLMIEQQIKAFNLNLQSRFLQFLKPGFDASLSDLLTTLLSGATAVLLPRKNLINVHTLKEEIKNYKITHIDLPPSLLNVIEPKDFCNQINTIIIGGEACPKKTIKKWCSKINLINVYGPTEATICTSMIKCGPNWNGDFIGIPLRHIDYLIDPSNQELLIGGKGIALNYWNNQKLTEERFVSRNNKRYFKTGDKVKLNQNKIYEFCGRLDRQVKIAGQLVHLAEIEKNLLTHPKIIECAVVCDSTPKMPQIHAHIATKENLIEEDILIYLKTKLPTYMQPRFYHFHKKLPRNTNSKIDYKKLKSSSILEIAQKFLKLPSLKYEDHFLNAGADSLSLICFLNEIEKTHPYLKYEDLYIYPSVKQLEEKIHLNQNKLEIYQNEVEKLAKKFFTLEKQKPEKIKNILMTGASGFVGIHLLKELLDKTDFHITCLVRSKNNSTGLEKLKNQVQRFLNRDLPSNKISVIVGDIRKKNLGLSNSKWDELKNNIDVILNSAAEVHLYKNYEQLFKSNVLSVLNILDLFKSQKAKELWHISTLSIILNTNQTKKTIDESPTQNNFSEIYGGYAQTKWVSDQLVTKLILENKISAKIFRLGLITPHAYRPIFSGTEQLRTFLKSNLSDLKKENDSLAFNITPVNWASDKIIKEIKNRTQTHFNIITNENWSLNQIQKWQKQISQSQDLKFTPLEKHLIRDCYPPFPNHLFLATNRIFETKQQKCHLGFDLFKSYWQAANKN